MLGAYQNYSEWRVVAAALRSARGQPRWDTAGVHRDTAGVHRDTVAIRRDTVAVRRDTVAGRRGQLARHGDREHHHRARLASAQPSWDAP